MSALSSKGGICLVWDLFSLLNSIIQSSFGFSIFSSSFSCNSFRFLSLIKACTVFLAAFYSISSTFNLDFLNFLNNLSHTAWKVSVFKVILVFPTFKLNTKRYSVSLCISSYSVRLREDTDQNNSEYRHILSSLKRLFFLQSSHQTTYLYCYLL